MVTKFMLELRFVHSAETLRRANEEEEASRRKAAETERELSECVCLLESSLQNSLAAVLEEEMKAAFGELWTEVLFPCFS